MSMFGDSVKGQNKNDLYSMLKDFFEDGGTWQDLFEVLETLCEYSDKDYRISR